MKKSISLVFIILFSTILIAGLFESEETKALKEKTVDQLIEIIQEEREQHRKEKAQFKKDYNKLYKEYEKYFSYYNEKSKLPLIFRNIHFSVTGGISAILKPDNLLKSNFDFLIQGSFYYKYMKFSVGYQPVNKNMIVGVGVFFP